MIPKEVSSVDESDLQDLARRGVAEGRQLEFKRSLPGKSDEDVREFLRDVTSFANAGGGDLIFGVDERVDDCGSTVAGGVVGVSGDDSDKVRLRLENIMRDGIKPSLIGVRIQVVPLANGNTAFVLRIPQSWVGPHVVDCKGIWRFYSRNSAGKYQIDVSELRDAFARSDRTAQRLQQVRYERLAAIAADDTYAEQPKLVLHLQPVSAASERAHVDLEDAREVSERLVIPQVQKVNVEGISVRYAFEGLEVTYYRRSNGYVLLFRDGTLEAVDTSFFRRIMDRTGEPLVEHHFEMRLLYSIHRYLDVLADLGIVGPVSVSLALFGVRGRRLEVVRGEGPSAYVDFEGEPIGRDDLILPSAIISDVGNAACEALQSAVDMIWNAAGVSRSPLRLDTFDTRPRN